MELEKIIIDQKSVKYDMNNAIVLNEEIDYEILLAKYMAHIMDCEGSDFISQLNRGEVKFDESEVKILNKMKVNDLELG